MPWNEINKFKIVKRTRLHSKWVTYSAKTIKDHALLRGRKNLLLKADASGLFFENSIFPHQNLVKVMQSDTNEWHTTDEKTFVNSGSVPHPLLVSAQKFLLAQVSALKYYEVPLGASAYYLWWVRDLDLGLSWCFDGHQCLVLEPRYAPEILVGDVSVASVLVQQLQLHIGVPNQVVQLILLGFEISLKTNLAYLIKVFRWF